MNRVEVLGIAGLIELVLERYARRFGAVRNKAARELEGRLAKRECWGQPGLGATLRSLGPDGVFHRYPISLRSLELQVRFGEVVGEFVPREQWEMKKQEAFCQLQKQREKDWHLWRRDEDMLRECRKFIKQLKRVIV